MKSAFKLNQIIRKMWFLPTMFAAGAIATVATAHYSAALLPQELPIDISESAIEDILTIIGSSMLAVATFALATMVNALSGASQGTSPRAVRLIAEDRTAQASISAFVGAFLFSVVGIIALSGGFFTASGRLILFAATIVVVALVVGALIRWINKISSIGQVGETIERVEAATTAAFCEIARTPLFGCCEREAAQHGAVAVHADRVGFVQHLEPAELQKIAEEDDLWIHVVARPGIYATRAQPLAMVAGPVTEGARRRIRDAFVVGRNRTFDHDPLYGLVVLNEIASRALSPGVNDPGTAIGVIHAQIRILDTWMTEKPGQRPAAAFSRVSMRRITPQDVMTVAFRPIVRDGAGNVEVCLEVCEALQAIRAAAPHVFGRAVAETAVDLLARARSDMSHPPDLRAVEQAAAALVHADGTAGHAPARHPALDFEDRRGAE
ncbi:DUF2254 domain-containing protein [Caenispirillum bisanense]|uniref:Uncharacterized membrane protein n=1 Tax=Caenispirillum bisanense TaxID=414052 RepID=A0A286GEF5_9PROT|nr:DUF2254 domain-containing protein [Caenispirillum bisanense]SOD93394.1 Uncharacterized membrane protein [Caenispirillum bisanense]